MSKLENKETELSNLTSEVINLQDEYISELDLNPKYSLEVDPENKYGMTEIQKIFVKNYCEYKSIVAAAEFSNIDLDTARDYFVSFASQQEIKRINLAMYQRQFANRLLSLDEIGGYLTSLITDSNVAYADRLKTPEKLKVIQMLIDLNKFKLDSIQNPTLLMQQDIDSQLKNLSVETIRQLLNQENKMQSEDYKQLMPDAITPEESAYLNTLSSSELLTLIENTNAKEESNDTQSTT